MPQTLDYVRPRFEETQKPKFSAWWNVFFASMTLLSLIMMIILFQLTHNVAVRGMSAMILLAGICGFMMMYILFVSMQTRVDGQGVHVKFGPIRWITFDAGQIESATACTYDAKKEFNGWGMRIRQKEHGDCYTLSGDRGVRLKLRNDVPVLIGSERAEELAAAIQDLIAASPKPPAESPLS